MSQNARTLAATIASILALVLLGRVLTRDTTQRNWEIFTEMQYSAAFEPLSANPSFANGMTQQHLVPGVVPRSLHRTEPGAPVANPFQLDDAEALAAGGRMFQIYCATCHGGRGDGESAVVRRGMIRPASLHGARAKQLDDAAVFEILTKGQGNMAPLAAQLSPRERWQVITYLRSMQRN